MAFNTRRLAYHAVKRNASFIQKLSNNCLFQRFMDSINENAPVFPEEYNKRLLIHDFINKEVLNNSAISYLEFGVFQGESIGHWAHINTNPASRFFGFDCFEGLPEDWSGKKKGHFDVGGRIPKIDDDRVSFIPGFFQETLETFLENHELSNRLVIHLDADLYSATLYCLTMLNRYIEAGTIVVFDEFSDLEHEFAAFHDYIRSYLREFTVLCHTPNLGRIVVEFK